MIDFTMIFVAIGILVTLAMKHFNNKEFSWREFGIVVTINSVLILIVAALGYHANTLDYQLLNGEVTSKAREEVSCSHSYECHCRPVSCGKNCSKTKCDICYEHSHDYDYIAKTTVGDIIINRIDAQGVNTPPRFNRIKEHEPASVSASFTNYIKAAPDSLFNLSMLIDSSIVVPEYPEVYDYYRVNRVLVTPDISFSGASQLNDLINDSLRTIGKIKEVNIIVIVTGKDRDFADAVKNKWLGGKKNDVVIMIGLDQDKIKWANSFSFSKSDIVNVKLSHDIRDLEVLDVTKLHRIIIDDVTQYYERMDMEEFSYLMDTIDPPTWAIVIAAIFSIGFSIGLSLFMSRRDVRL
jgi:hypothetical protein